MKGIKTLEEAQKLPEKSPIKYNEEMMNGRKIVVPRFRDLVAIELEDDLILSFEDTDGRIMTIGYDSEGAYKYYAL